jgi:hypothetical protein
MLKGKKQLKEKFSVLNDESVEVIMTREKQDLPQHFNNNNNSHNNNSNNNVNVIRS